MAKRSDRHISVDGVSYRVEIVERPFREGREVHLFLGEEVVSLGELGLGDRELELRVTEEVRRRVSAKASS